MEKVCEICGNKTNEVKMIIIEGIQKVCNSCYEKFLLFENRKISIDEIISEYTPQNIKNSLEKISSKEDNYLENDFNNNKNDTAYYKSTIGTLIKLLSIAVLFLSVLGSLIIMFNYDMAFGIAAIIITILNCFLCYGIGEICCLLTSINEKIKQFKE